VSLLTLIASVLVFGLLVLAHEFGHLVAAKRAGIGVREFAIGFGPRLGGWTSGGTVYSLRLLPIGGYTIMVGSEPDEPETADAYKVKSVAQRSLVIAMGPLMNFALTFLIFASMFAVFGLPTDINNTSTAIGQVLPGYPADKAGLAPGDVLVSVNGRELTSWAEFDQAIAGSLGREVTLVYRRGRETRSVVLAPVTDPGRPLEGIIGVTPTLLYRRIGLGRSIVEGLTETWRVLAAWVTTLVDALFRRVPLDLAGPVMTVRFIGSTAKSGPGNLMYLAGFLSLNIGLFNLLPFPALDGGRLVFLAYEGLTRRKPDPRRENLVHFLGFAALILLMILITYRDIIRL
jgi:regulator of sigma E protease